MTAELHEVETGGGRQNARRPRPDRTVFRYRLVDLAGYEVDVLERDAPLRAGETVAAGSVPWRVVGVLGLIASVTRA